MRLCGFYGNNQVAVKYTEGESKIVNVENVLRIKMHLLVQDMNVHSICGVKLCLISVRN